MQTDNLTIIEKKNSTRSIKSVLVIKQQLFIIPMEFFFFFFLFFFFFFLIFFFYKHLSCSSLSFYSANTKLHLLNIEIQIF